MAHVDALRPNCEWTIAGGYRRGKATVADVDVVFSPPAGVEDPELIRALCARLSALGIVSHVLSEFCFHNIKTKKPPFKN
jgi:DNA polymerase mu